MGHEASIWKKNQIFSSGGAKIQKIAEKNFKCKYLHYFDAPRARPPGPGVAIEAKSSTEFEFGGLVS